MELTAYCIGNSLWGYRLMSSAAGGLLLLTAAIGAAETSHTVLLYYIQPLPKLQQPQSRSTAPAVNNPSTAPIPAHVAATQGWWATSRALWSTRLPDIRTQPLPATIPAAPLLKDGHLKALTDHRDTRLEHWGIYVLLAAIVFRGWGGRLYRLAPSNLQLPGAFAVFISLC